MAQSLRLGFIGLGAMGRPMALHLVRGGYPMTVYARRPQAVEPLVAAGARAVASPADVARESDVVFTLVTATADSEEVTLGAGGIVEGARAGSVVVDMATIAAHATRTLAQALEARGVEHLDAPVSGGPMGAESATLAIMVGGKAQVFGRVRPLFDMLGKTILHMGGHGAGQVTKACNQLSLTVTLQGVAEALAIARRSGVDPARVREVMLGGIAASRVLEVFGARMVTRDFANGIDARLYHKDLNLVLGMAHELGVPAPAAAATLQQINALIGSGGGRSDFSRMIEVLERAMTDQGEQR